MNTTCLICSQGLRPEEIQLNAKWHFACEICAYCKDPMPAPDHIEACLAKGIPPSHTTCWQNAMYQKFKNHDLPITIQHLRYLNDQLCEMRFAFDAQREDLRLIQEYLIASSELAKNVSWIRQQVKQNIDIRESRDYATSIFETNERTKGAERIKQEVQINKQERSAQLKAEKTDPQLKADRKAAEAWAKTFNISLAEAAAYLEEQKNALCAKKEIK